MTKLIYRGKNYVQKKEIAEKEFIELTYRRNVYINRKEKADSQSQITHCYRGVNY